MPHHCRIDQEVWTTMYLCTYRCIRTHMAFSSELVVVSFNLAWFSFSLVYPGSPYTCTNLEYVLNLHVVLICQRY